ncbi:hypothetical protein Bca4012_007554 [Brassica carinata]
MLASWRLVKLQIARLCTEKSWHALALQLIHEAASKLEQQDGHENREFIILVLDPDVQMLPWENIPVLTKQEVYRMPSAGPQYMSSRERVVAAMNLKGNNKNTKRTRKPSSHNQPAQSNVDESRHIECNHKHGRKIDVHS